MFQPRALVGLFGAAATVLPHPFPPPAPAMRSAPSVIRAGIVRQAPSGPPQGLPSETPAAEEQAFVDLVNAERTRRGLNALASDPLLSETARAHSVEMCALCYFDHRSPTPGLSSPMARYLKRLADQGRETPTSLLIGENLYYSSECSRVHGIPEAHQALMASAGHRANILDPDFTRVGLGVCHDAQGGVWVTEMFLRDTSLRR